jgi:hypothetical protein
MVNGTFVCAQCYEELKKSMCNLCPEFSKCRPVMQTIDTAEGDQFLCVQCLRVYPDKESSEELVSNEIKKGVR